MTEMPLQKGYVAYAPKGLERQHSNFYCYDASLSALQELENVEMSCKDISQIIIACDNFIN